MVLTDSGIVALASVVIAVTAWSLSRPAKPSDPNGLVAPILLTLAVVVINLGAGVIWFKTEWTIVGRVRDPSLGWLLAFLVLPGAIAAGIYAGLHRSR